MKNIGSQFDKKIEDFRTALIKLRNAFIDEAAVITEITAFQILDDMGIISSQLDGMATQLKWVSSHVLDSGTYSSCLENYQPDDGQSWMLRSGKSHTEQAHDSHLRRAVLLEHALPFLTSLSIG